MNIQKRVLKMFGIVLVIVLIAAQHLQAGEEDSPGTADTLTVLNNSSLTAAAPAASEQDATYVIKTGDTLWDLAFQFLGNPFDWHKVWEINSYITNPDLIYPGNTLRIPGRSSFSGTESVQANIIPSETFGAVDFKAAAAVDTSGSYPGDIEVLSTLESKNILSEAQLSSAPFLWSEKDQKGLIYPGNGEVDKVIGGASYQLFSKIPISLFKDAKYATGDTVDIYTSLRLVMFNDKVVNLIRRTGRAVVRVVTAKKMNALLFEMSDVIAGGERIVARKKIESLKIDTLISPEAAISAEVFTRVEQTVSPYPFQMIVLNKGSTHGVQVGDVFAVYNQKSALLSVIGIIVHTGTQSSTLNMAFMRQNLVDEGDAAKLIRRAKFLEREKVNDGKVSDSGITETN